jgi:hypothetical protein
MVSGFPLGAGDVERRVVFVVSADGSWLQSIWTVRIDMTGDLDQHCLVNSRHSRQGENRGQALDLGVERRERARGWDYRWGCHTQFHRGGHSAGSAGSCALAIARGSDPSGREFGALGRQHDCLPRLHVNAHGEARRPIHAGG